MGAPADSAQWILWAGTVGFSSPLPERFAAAVANGCRRVSLSPGEGVEGDAVAIGAQARDLGLELVLDPIMNWYPTQTPATSRFAAVTLDDALRAAEQLGVVSMTAIAIPGETAPPPDLADHFGALCDRVAAFGAQVQLEFIPFTSLPSLRLAWEVVRAADRPNGGLLFDSWHFHHGDPDYDVLAGVPGEKVFCVQLDDAPAGMPEDVRAATHRRLLPGEGELPLARDIRALAEIGGLTWVGPEVINPELAARPVAESAELAVTAARRVVADALA